VQFLKYLGLSWLANAVTLGIVAGIFDNIEGGSFGQMLAAGGLFGVLNTVLKPLLRLLTLPLAVLTLGVAWFGVSMLMLKLTDLLVKGFDIHGFGTLFWATVVVWAVNVVLELVTLPWRPRRAGSRVR
jgi:putative membrane protein